MTLLSENKPIFGPPGRRGRRLPWWLIPVAVVVGLAVLAGSLRSETREVVAYIDTAQPMLSEQAAMAEAFEDLVRLNFSSIEREDFTTFISRAETGLRGAVEELDAGELPDAAVVADEMLRLALNAWEVGLNAFGAGVLNAADDPTSPAPVVQIETGIMSMRMGDAFYVRFLERSAALADAVDVGVGEFPEISFAEGEPTLASAANVAQFVRTSSVLGVKSDVAILSVVFDPPDSGGETTDGAMIFPVTDDLLLRATVSNVGNQDEKGLTVQLTMFDSNGAVVENLDSAQVDLAAGQATAVEFGPITVAPGQRYLLLIDVTRGPEEIVTDNNRWERELVVSSP